MRYKQVLFILCIIVFACFLPRICPGDDRNPNYVFDIEENSNENNDIAIYLDGPGHNLLLIQTVIPGFDGQQENQLGFGYRGVLNDNSILLGVNSIFNFSKDDMFSYQGIGLEAFYQMFEFRASSRFVFSPEQFANKTDMPREENVQAYEAELGLPVPYLNWISLYGGAFWFDYENFSDSEGWKFRGEVRPFRYIVLNLTAYDDGSTEYKADAAVSLPFDIFSDNFPGDDLFNVGFSEEAYPDRIDHSLKMFDNFRIDE